MNIKINRIERNGEMIDDLLSHYEVENPEEFKTGELTIAPTDLLADEVSNVIDSIGFIVAGANLGMKFGIVVDDDADGFTSSAILTMYLKDLFPDIDLTAFHHEHKTHGLTPQIMEELQSAELDIILIPDAGANDNEQHNQLTFCGAKVIVIDHHIIEESEIPTTALIVSNQNEDNPIEINRGLTGAGMVLRFCEAIDKLTGNNFAKDYYDFAAIGQIGDASNIAEPEIHSIVMNGMKNIKSPFIKEAIGDHAEKEIAPPIGMSFSIIPMINAITRVGTLEEKAELFAAMCNKEEPEIVYEERRRKDKETGKFNKVMVPFRTTELEVEKFMKIKTRQANLVKKALESIKYVNTTGSVAITELEDFDIKIGGITGLIANKIASKFQLPALVLIDRGERMVGSGRGFEKKMVDLREWVLRTELAEWAKGHDNAFGTSIHKDQFEEFAKKAGETIDGSTNTRSFDVIETQEKRINVENLMEATEHEYLYGGAVESPLFYFKDIKINKRAITSMAGGTCLSFYSNGVTFIAFGLAADSFDEFDQGFKQQFDMDFIGKPGMSNWRGRVQLQVILEHYEQSPDRSDEEFDEETFIF